MKYLSLSLLSISLLLTSSQCDKEVVSTYGHLKLAVTYPEVVHEADTFYYVPTPGVGAEVRLYDKEAVCLGYKDAMLNLVKIGGQYSTSMYLLVSNEKGEVLFTDIPIGEYYLIVFARQLSKYTEKYIEVNGGDTLKLVKNFTPDLTYWENLEPWDHEVPGYKSTLFSSK